MSRFKKFGVTILPKGAEETDWTNMTKEAMTEELRRLAFITPMALAKLLGDISIKDGLKADKQTYNLSKINDFGGQLELGGKNNKPHYQLWIELTRRETKKKLITELSQLLYEEDFSPAISVIPLTTEIQDYKNYCAKDERANLLDEYEHIVIDGKIQEFHEYLKENPSAKKFLTSHIDTKYG